MSSSPSRPRPRILPTTDEPGRTSRPPCGTTGRAGFLGAMFLMATSAIGPGFLTQTTTFTVQLGAAFAFVILVTVIVDIAIQLNVWRIIGISGRRAQDLANHALPGAGFLLAALDVFGGIVFNIGNIAGCSLGLEALFGLDVRVGGVISAVVAIGVFLVRRAGVAMDRVVILLGDRDARADDVRRDHHRAPGRRGAQAVGRTGHVQLPGAHHADRRHRRRLHRLRRGAPPRRQRGQGRRERRRRSPGPRSSASASPP